MQKDYKTVLNQAVCEIEEKKSRFITNVKPVQSEEEALSFINSLKTKYWDATHNVYAYNICGNNIIQRFSDDGEPSGTAGLPVLEVVKRMGIQDVAVVVTRYFGGTLLGASGLIRTYGKSASLGLEQAVVVWRKLCDELGIISEYTMLGKIQNLLSSKGYTVKGMVYEQDVDITVYVPVNESEDFVREIIEVSNARVLVETRGKSYITVDMDGKLIDS
ncbi:MAG: YigZ family protein [Bacillota bacterium]|nr:YigZ family protein [Bacillota bacterium]